MDLLQAMQVSATGMSAHRSKINVIAENLANAESTRTQDDEPYRRKMVVFSEKRLNDFRSVYGRLKSNPSGVQVTDVVRSQKEFRLVHNPDHPDADPETGFVSMPNVDLLTEIADMMIARRSFEANVTALSNTRSMILKALEIGK